MPYAEFGAQDVDYLLLCLTMGVYFASQVQSIAFKHSLDFSIAANFERLHPILSCNIRRMRPPKMS